MKLLLPIFLGLTIVAAYGQTPAELKKADSLNSITRPITPRRPLTVEASDSTNSELKDSINTADPRSLLDFYIPSALFTFNVEPASVSRVTISAVDTKFSFKYGFRDKSDTPDPNAPERPASGWGFAFSSKLADGAKTLFTPDDISKEYSLKIIRTFALRNRVWVLSKSKALSSVQSRWINVNLNTDINQKNVFTGDTVFTKHNNVNAQLLITFNNLFNSLIIKKYIRHRNIFNLGLGYGWFDNYESLKSYTLRRSVVNTAGSYVGENSSVVGKRGTFQQLNGVIGVASVFIPLTSPTQLTSLILGGNGTMFGIGSSNYTATVNAGFFLSQRTFKEGKLTENFSFGVLAVWSQLQKRQEANYAKDNFSIILTAQIPISFQ
ncbi:hypothetical protein [Spirosoma luteum]|uniref:hypothetical protein n=1 Tax=Spirosoma luteum TaxID=431553 RepID=UPI0003A629BB|nr:hypothetical protein [Spirosoma luteum]